MTSHEVTCITVTLSKSALSPQLQTHHKHINNQHTYSVFTKYAIKPHRTAENSYDSITNLLKLYQLQNLIVSLLVIEQIQCFMVEMKGKDSCF